MFSMTRSLIAAQRDASRRVAEARTFSVRLPFVGAVRVPPPDQLAFYGVLGGLVVHELIDWPVALAMGIGQAVVARHISDLEAREEAPTAPVRTLVPVPNPAPPAPAARKAPARAPAKRTPAKKAPAKKAAAKKTPAKKTPAKKAPAKRTSR